uniref:Uncharacterized protein n=1 Tax=Manihot esculenta TaxID=3983 RepID=A0A2C9VCQ9_MANES
MAFLGLRVYIYRLFSCNGISRMACAWIFSLSLLHEFCF